MVAKLSYTWNLFLDCFLRALYDDFNFNFNFDQARGKKFKLRPNTVYENTLSYVPNSLAFTTELGTKEQQYISKCNYY